MQGIEATGLVKRFGAFTAVDGVDLSIAEGELFGLLGVNGAGKTTTIRMLSCLSRPTDGSIAVCGHSVTGEREKVKAITDVSPQETAVSPNLTVRENLIFIAGIYGFAKKDAAARADSLLARFGFGELADKRAKLLSGGWQRRLSIAMALITEPRVLFLDEPTLGLDVLARRELWRVITGLKGKITVVLTTHYLEEAEALCDRIAIMVQGIIVACGTADELKQQAGCEKFEDAFVAIAEGVGK